MASAMDTTPVHARRVAHSPFPSATLTFMQHDHNPRLRFFLAALLSGALAFGEVVVVAVVVVVVASGVG